MIVNPCWIATKITIMRRPVWGSASLLPGGWPFAWAKSRVLVAPECVQVNVGRVARHGDEFLPSDGEGLPGLDGVHDLPQLRPQVALRDLR
jgi:hypothetical protein